jgi:hypothetical protein
MTVCLEVPTLPRSRTVATPHFAIHKVLGYSYDAAVLGYYMIKYDNITSTMSKYDAEMQRISKKFKEYIDY